MHVPYLGPAPDPDPAILALEIAHTDTVIDRTTAEHDRGRLPLLVLGVILLLAGCAHKGPQMPVAPILDEEPSCHEELDPNQLKDL